MREYLKISRADEIARRYFVMNGFDGALTTLGVIMGSTAAGVSNPRVVVSAGLGASLAMGISGAWGAYMAEKAERTRAMKELEEALFTDLDRSVLHRASNAAVAFVAFIDAISPVLASLISLAPFILAISTTFPLAWTLGVAVLLNLGTLFVLGVFLGRISRSHTIGHGILMVLAGAITAAIILLLEMAL